MSLDTKLIKESFAEIADQGSAVVEYFYAHLFAHSPELRWMFPVGMAEQRDRLFRALTQVALRADDVEGLEIMLTEFGRDHRKYEVEPHHYPAVGASLIATLELFAVEVWTPEHAAAWQAAYELAASIMIKAASEMPPELPLMIDADVVGHERRVWDIAVIQVKPRVDVQYIPGQYIAIETQQWPRQWRTYSIANAPREDGTLEFHVKQVDSGQVSWALVDSLQVGHVVKLGQPAGVLTLHGAVNRDLLLIAGGTGLAPFKAMIQDIAARGGDRAVRLFMGARKESDLYDLSALLAFASRHPWLTVTPVVSDEDSYSGLRGLVGDVAAGLGPWMNYDAYVCGPRAMVVATQRRLLGAGVQPEHLHHEAILDLPRPMKLRRPPQPHSVPVQPMQMQAAQPSVLQPAIPQQPVPQPAMPPQPLVQQTLPPQPVQQPVAYAPSPYVAPPRAQVTSTADTGVISGVIVNRPGAPGSPSVDGRQPYAPHINGRATPAGQGHPSQQPYVEQPRVELSRPPVLAPRTPRYAPQPGTHGTQPQHNPYAQQAPPAQPYNTFGQQDAEQYGEGEPETDERLRQTREAIESRRAMRAYWRRG